MSSVPIPTKPKDNVEEAFLHEGQMHVDFEHDPDAARECSKLHLHHLIGPMIFRIVYPKPVHMYV